MNQASTPPSGSPGRTWGFRETIKRWVRPPGTCLILLGPDGAGKSLLIENLKKNTYTGVIVQHLRPNAVLSKARTYKTSATSKPHDRPNYSPAKSVAKLLYLILDYNVGYWRKVRPQMARGQLFIFDRYFYDIVIDPMRFRYGGPVWLAKLALHLVPRPSLGVVLLAPAEVIYRRKQDLTMDELHDQLGRYEDLACALSFMHILDATQTPEKVAADLAARLAAHTPPRLAMSNG